MADDNHSSDGNNDHRLLAKLLERQRDSEHKKAVDEVLERDLPVPEKVRSIERIDASYSRKGYLSGRRRSSPNSGASDRQAVDGVSTPESVDALLSQEEDPQWKRELRRKRVDVKARVEPVGLIGLLFYDWPRIRRFNREYGVLKLGVLPFRMTIAPNRIRQLKEELIPAAQRLGSLLTPILGEAWRHVSKEEYNLLVLLSGLCNVVSAIDAKQLNATSRDLLKQFRSVERNLYVYRKQDPTGNRGDRALSRYRESAGDDALDWSGARSRMFLLVGSHENGGVLETLMLGLNIVYHRRYLTVDSLINPGVGSLISSDHFECSAEVEERIRAYLKDIILQLPPYVEALRELRRLQLFLPEGELLDPLRSFYKARISETKTFEQARENTLALILSLAQELIKSAEPLLDGTVLLKSYGNRRVFAPDFFNEELSRSGLLLSRLEKLTYSFPSFPEERFFQLKRSEGGATSLESEALGLTEDLLFIFVRLGKKLIDLMGKRSESPLEAETDHLPIRSELLQRSQIYVPELTGELQNPLFGASGSLIEEMQSLTELLLAIPRYFEESSLISSVRRESRLKRELERRLSIVSAIAPPETAAQIRDTYSL